MSELGNYRTLEWLSRFKKRLSQMKVPDIDDPEGCPLCGAIAGVCNDYPKCKEKWPEDSE